ncbi:MAG TPA: SusD/RagB family nutrient-binding outer membrane lipoprotein [Chitinophagaceae bacterium]|nr:SusD/RagB family nutrient-binding outer membrane lipoprotein [Chitinophagaceae bacterium]
MNRKYIIIALAIVATGLGSCKKSFFDINHNPNNATNANPELVLPTALTNSANQQVIGQLSQGYAVSYVSWQGWMGYWAPSGSYAINASDVASYKITTTFGDFGIWQPNYDNLEDYDYTEKNAIAEGKPFYEGVARIMKALIFQQLVDCYGDVPYSDALHGTTIIEPRYDKGSAIYDSIVDQINIAVELLKRPDAVAANNSDVVFDGDASKWIQFANTLKLRILLRESEVSGKDTYIKSEIAKSVANGYGFLTEDAGANPGYANNSGQQSPVYGFFVTITGLPTSGGTGDYWRAAQYSLNFLGNHNDPRISRLYAKVNGQYIGTTLGSTSNPTSSNSSTVGPGILQSASQPAILISAAESYFLQAEANLRGWLGAATDATANFDAGVQSSFDYLGSGDATTYYSQPGDKNTNITACTTFNEKLACLIRQKWVAMNSLTPLESWDDYRRLHLPADIPLSVSPYSQGNIPVRLQYPNSEYQTNASNANAEGTIDSQKTKVFWMP